MCGQPVQKTAPENKSLKPHPSFSTFKECLVYPPTFLPTYTGIPMIIAGMAMPAISAMPTGAPTSVPNCHRIFFFLLQGFLPQNVHPEGLCQEQKYNLSTKVILMSVTLAFISSHVVLIMQSD